MHRGVLYKNNNFLHVVFHELESKAFSSQCELCMSFYEGQVAFYTNHRNKKFSVLTADFLKFSVFEICSIILQSTIFILGSLRSSSAAFSSLIFGISSNC